VTKPIIITTEEVVIQKGAVTKKKCNNNDRIEAITQEKSPSVNPRYTMSYSQTLEATASGYEIDIEINTHSADKEKTAVREIIKGGGPSGSKILDDGMYVDVAQKPTSFSINDESDDTSISNRKRKHELHDEVYYKLLLAILKVSKTIQSSRDYWKKSYILRDKNEKEEYKVIVNKGVIK
ncbi:7304_t:CDS:2, partial [Ambispora gerdemannii]